MRLVFFVVFFVRGKLESTAMFSVCPASTHFLLRVICDDSEYEVITQFNFKTCICFDGVSR